MRGNLKLTDYWDVQLVKKHLALVITQMKLDYKDYGFHMFRRSVASLAYSLQVP